MLPHSTVYEPLALRNSSSENIEKPIKGWPEEPGPLKNGGAAYIVRVLSDIVAVAATCPFLLLGAYAASKNGQPVKEHEWQNLQEAMKVAVTAYPIVFAAVMGRMTRTAATWRLERGITLGKLEQLFWSSTVFSTLSTQFLLRSFNVLSIGLVILWALSPLGGQSTLRIISTVAHSVVSNNTVTALNTEQLSLLEGGSTVRALVPILNSLYLTAITAPQRAKVSPEDLWGNVKIPMISHLDPAIRANDSGWYTFRAGAELPYSSLIGVSTTGVSQTGNTTFNIETSYFDLDCFNLTAQAEPIPITKNFVFKKEDLGTWPVRIIPAPNGVFIGSNGTEYCPFTAICLNSFSIAMSHMVENWSHPGPGIKFPLVTGNEKTFLRSPPTLLFQSKFGGGIAAFCSIKRIYVESAITCIGDPSGSHVPQCAVTAMRDSLQPHEPSDIVPFLFVGPAIQFSARLAQSSGLGHVGDATITELYLNNTENPLVAGATALDLANITKRQLSRRLSQVLNTYFLPSLLLDGVVDDLANYLKRLKAIDRPPEDADLPERTYNYSTHRVPAVISTHPYDIYVISTGWMVVFMISSITMFIAAVMSTVVGFRTAIPDILGYASTMTRDSKYFHLPPGGSRLDGLTRSRYLRDWVVRLGDVRSESEVGHVAFAEKTTAMRVKRNGLYE